MDAGALGEGCEELGGVAGESEQQESLGTLSGKTEPALEQGKSLAGSCSLLQFCFL